MVASVVQKFNISKDYYDIKMYYNLHKNHVQIKIN